MTDKPLQTVGEDFADWLEEHIAKGYGRVNYEAVAERVNDIAREVCNWPKDIIA